MRRKRRHHKRPAAAAVKRRRRPGTYKRYARGRARRAGTSLGRMDLMEPALAIVASGAGVLLAGMAADVIGRKVNVQYAQTIGAALTIGACEVLLQGMSPAIRIGAIGGAAYPAIRQLADKMNAGKFVAFGPERDANPAVNLGGSQFYGDTAAMLGASPSVLAIAGPRTNYMPLDPTQYSSMNPLGGEFYGEAY